MSTFQRRAIGFQGFERRRGRLGERRLVLFDRGQRFADPGSEFAGNLTQGSSGRLLFSPPAPAPRRGRLRCGSSWRASPTRTGFRGWQSSLPGRRRWRFARRFPARAPESAAHPPAGPSDRASVWMRSSETRLRKGDCSSCTANPWRSVPSNTGSPVVFVKSARTIVSLSVSLGVRWKVEVTCGSAAAARPRQRNHHLPAFCDSGCGCGLRTGCHPRRIRVPLQALQVGANFRSVLVAQVAIFSRHLSMMRSSSAGKSGFRRTGGTGARLRMESKMIAVLSPRNGSLPVAIS